MKNKNAMAELIKQTRKIEENNFLNMEHTTSISILLNSNDLTQSKDKKITDKVEKLNRQIEDINKLTSDLLNDLTSKHN